MDIPSRTLDEVFAVSRFMRDFARPWWFGGGWAVDLWLGGQSREHEDIEVCVLRRDQPLLRSYCVGWQRFKPVDGQWAAIADSAPLEAADFMLQLQRTPETPVSIPGMPPVFEFLLNDLAEDGRWLFRPDPGIRLPLDAVAELSPLGLRVTRPEIVLLHKALYVRPKDEHDFQQLRPRLSADRRSWLRTHLAQLRPEHPWLAQVVLDEP